MKITGRYTKDQNFITVFCDNKIYTISRNSRDWRSLPVGGQTATGHILTQEDYNSLMAECGKEGTFEIEG